MKKVIFLFIAIIFAIITTCAQAQKTYTEHQYRNSSTGSMPKTQNEVVWALQVLADNDIAAIKTIWSFGEEYIPTFRKQVFSHIASAIGVAYTDPVELMPYIKKGSLINWPDDKRVMLALYSVPATNKVRIRYAERDAKHINEKLFTVNGRVVLSNLCFNPAFILWDMTVTVDSMYNDTNNGSLLTAPKLLSVPQQVAPEEKTEDFYIKKANLNASFRNSLGDGVNQTSFIIEKEKKAFFKTTVGKVLKWAVPLVGGYFAYKALFPVKTPGGGFSQGGAGGSSGGGFSQGG